SRSRPAPSGLPRKSAGCYGGTRRHESITGTRPRARSRQGEGGLTDKNGYSPIRRRAERTHVLDSILAVREERVHVVIIVRNILGANHLAQPASIGDLVGVPLTAQAAEGA